MVWSSIVRNDYFYVSYWEQCFIYYYYYYYYFCYKSIQNIANATPKKGKKHAKKSLKKGYVSEVYNLPISIYWTSDTVSFRFLICSIKKTCFMFCRNKNLHEPFLYPNSPALKKRCDFHWCNSITRYIQSVGEF